MISTLKTNFWFRATFISVMATAAFAPCLRGTFVFDDIPAVVENKIIHSKEANLSSAFLHDFWGEPAASDMSHGSYRPLTTLLFRFLYQSSSGSPLPFHILNTLGGNSIEKNFGLIFDLKNGLRLRFDSVACLNYPNLNFFLISEPQSKTQVIFQAKTQAQFFFY